MAAWLKRFGLHLAAAVGATGIFVAAAAVGATQTRQQVVVVSAPTALLRPQGPAAQRKPSVVVAATPTPVAAVQPPGQTAVDASDQATPPSTVAPQTPDAEQPTAVPAQAQSGTPPGAQQPAAGVPKPGAANQASPRPIPRGTPNARASASPTPAVQKVVPERSLAGTIKAVLPDGLDVVGVGGREWHVVPAPGALIRLNGRAARLDGLLAGDTLVILGQAQSGPGNPFLAHAITARRK